jgi:hypothetical protein
MPARSIAKATPHEEEPPEEAHSHDATQAASEAVTASTFGHQESEPAQRPSHIGSSGKHAIAQYSYEKAEDNELELREGEQVTDIDMVDEDWWMGKNERGETGLFPSNYVELVEDRGHAEKSAAHEAEEHVAPAAPAGAAVGAGVTATAIYDYEAAEDNELTFAEHDKITNVVSLFSLYLFSRRYRPAPYHSLAISRRGLVEWRVQRPGRPLPGKLRPIR